MVFVIVIFRCLLGTVVLVGNVEVGGSVSVPSQSVLTLATDTTLSVAGNIEVADNSILNLQSGSQLLVDGMQTVLPFIHFSSISFLLLSCSYRGTESLFRIL